MLLELVKQNIPMNRWKNQISTQVTLDDDFIVPDTLDDIEQVLLTSGEIQLEPVKTQKEKAVIRGKLDFHILYQKEEGGLQTLGGVIPFEENVNVPGLEEQDEVSVSWQMEDLSASVINSRKLSIKALAVLQVKVESLFDTEAAIGLAQEAGAGDQAESSGPVSADNSVPLIETRQSRMDAASIALRRKDTCRLKEELTLSGSKPAIDQILWTEMRLSGATARPMDGKIHLEGSLLVFVIYEGENGPSMVQWMEESIPFSTDVEAAGASEEMIPAVSIRLIHRAIEAKPDYDGEMRDLDVDAVIELDIRLYEEKPVELLSDLYATNREVNLMTGEACFDRILTHNTGKCRVAGSISMDTGHRILQICHSTGSVKIDDAAPVPEQDSLSIDGVLEVQLLYLTDDDAAPVQSVTEMLPFHYDAQAQGITKDSIWYLETGLEQLTAAMTGGDSAEVKAVVTLELLVLQPVCQTVIRQAEVTPLDTKKVQKMPGIAGYLVQPGDELWDIAKRFHTTQDNILMTNHLGSEQLHTGDVLILVKEITR
jgi:LysM repeat protein